MFPKHILYFLFNLKVLRIVDFENFILHRPLLGSLVIVNIIARKPVEIAMAGIEVQMILNSLG